MTGGTKGWTPVCVASTRSRPATQYNQGSSCPAIDTCAPLAHEEGIDQHYFKGAEWSTDGTTVLTDSADHHIRSFILPPDLLSNKAVHRISPYSTIPSAEPTYATAIYPFYDLQDPSTTLFLSSVRDHPIRLASTLAPTCMATYSLVNPNTEAFITPHSIIYPSALGGRHFLTGSDSLICLFDVSRPGGDGPVSWMPTIPSKRNQLVGGGVGMKGIVSALAVNPAGDGILAAGTFTRHVGLYSSNGAGELLGTFSIAKTDADRDIGGKGVTQLAWSPCGRYLYVAERKSDGILVYDIRVTGQMLGYLRGRKANTNQRMKIDVAPAGCDGSHEIWAGGTDGYVRVWKDPVYAAGGQDPDWEFKAHEDVVTSAVFHPMGSVVATCSGQRHRDFEDTVEQTERIRSSTNADNTLKIWSLPYLELGVDDEGHNEKGSM